MRPIGFFQYTAERKEAHLHILQRASFLVYESISQQNAIILLRFKRAVAPVPLRDCEPFAEEFDIF